MKEPFMRAVTDPEINGGQRDNPEDNSNDFLFYIIRYILNE